MKAYSVLRDGVVVQIGNSDNEELLLKTFPEPTFSLVLGEHLPFDARVPTYQDQRRMAYPPLADLADALYWQLQGDNSKMDAYNAAVAAVKQQFPKPA